MTRPVRRLAWAGALLLVFALLANRVSSLAATRETMDAIASRLAGCGCS